MGRRTFWSSVGDKSMVSAASESSSGLSLGPSTFPPTRLPLDFNPRLEKREYNFILERVGVPSSRPQQQAL